MSDTNHCDLAAVLPYSEPVLVSPPLILVWRGHGSTFPLCSGLSSLSAPGGGEGRVRWGIPERGAGTHLTLPSLRDGPLPLPPEGRRGAIVSKICASTKRRPATRGSAGLGPPPLGLPPRTSPRRRRPPAPCRAGCPGDWNRN